MNPHYTGAIPIPGALNGSIAATAIAAISSRRVHLNLFVTSETNSEGASRRTAARVSDGTESMLVRLAAATPVESQLGEERIREAIQFSRSQPTLIVSMIDLKSPQRHTVVAQLPPSVTYIPVRPPRVSATDLGEGDLRDR